MLFSQSVFHPHDVKSTHNPAVICYHSICTAAKKTLLNCRHVFNFIKDGNLAVSCTGCLITVTGKSELFSCH